MSKDRNKLLPAGFQFSQGSLRDFSECPYRFKLKYVDKQAWPAVISEPALEAEHRARMGSVFHRMIQQHQSGIDPEILEPTISGYFPGEGQEELRIWWKNYLVFSKNLLSGKKYPELSLITRISNFRLFARLDLLCLDLIPGNQALIIDWKTSTKPGKRDLLNTALQTRVYRYTLMRCATLVDHDLVLEPEMIKMMYWYASVPDQSVVLQYSLELFQDDEQVLSDLIHNIRDREREDFQMTSNERLCQHCVYRSLCERGISAGPLTGEENEEFILGLDFDDIEEIAF